MGKVTQNKSCRAEDGGRRMHICVASGGPMHTLSLRGAGRLPGDGYVLLSCNFV